MLSRIFTQAFVRTGEQHPGLPSRILSNVRVGRMAPETTKDTIAKELQAELQEKGFAQVSKTLNQEKIILKELQEHQKESLQRIKELCVTPAQRRSAEGYNINGLFWHQKQQELKQIDTKEALQNREETIDWLKTRQDLYTVLKETPNTTPESFTENFSFNW